MKCKFCGNDTKLIEAHIIPAGLFRRLQKGKKPLVLMTNISGDHIKRSPNGVYDKTIVCGKCERIWQEWDKYAQQLLVDDLPDDQIRYHNNKKICYVIKNYDYKKLKLFFISMIWRASVSSQPFFSKVSLGEFELVAKKHIANNNPGGNEDFSVILAKFDHPRVKPILDPHDDKQFDVNYFRFYLAGYVAYIKVDHKPNPMPLSLIAMDENKPLYIICRNIEKSKEPEVMVNILKFNRRDKFLPK
jgi:hypothetical protein